MKNQNMSKTPLTGPGKISNLQQTPLAGAFKMPWSASRICPPVNSFLGKRLSGEMKFSTQNIASGMQSSRERRETTLWLSKSQAGGVHWRAPLASSTSTNSTNTKLEQGQRVQTVQAHSPLFGCRPMKCFNHQPRAKNPTLKTHSC